MPRRRYNILSDPATRASIRGGLNAHRGLRAFDSRTMRTRLPGPLAVQVQTVDRCNGACIMCPYAATQGRGSMNHMDPDLYLSILLQIRDVGTVKAMNPMLQNEPLLDPLLPQRIALARKIMGPKLRMQVVTNGTLFTPKIAGELAEAGAGFFSVSIDAAKPGTYAKIRKGLSYERVVKNLSNVLRQRPDLRVEARFLRQAANHGEEAEFCRYWRSQGAGVLLHSVYNRSGGLGNFEKLKASRPSLVRRIKQKVTNALLPCCPLPFCNMAVTWDGRAILCCHDWKPLVEVGDLQNSSIAEIWQGSTLAKIREHLYRGRPERIASCANCSVPGNVGM